MFSCCREKGLKSSCLLNMTLVCILRARPSKLSLGLCAVTAVPTPLEHHQSV